MPSDRHSAVSYCRQAHAIRPAPSKGHCRQEPSQLPPGAMSCSRSLELVKQALERASIDSTEYGKHSLRSSGITAAARAHVAEHLIQRHGGWKSASSKKYTFSPAELSSEREEKEVLAEGRQPTAPPSMKSHVSYCAARALRREKMEAEGTSSTTGRSLLHSVLVAAVDSCHCPHPFHPSTALLPIASLSLSLSLTMFDAFKNVIVLNCAYCATNSRRATAAPRLSASLCGFSL